MLSSNPRWACHGPWSSRHTPLCRLLYGTIYLWSDDGGLGCVSVTSSGLKLSGNGLSTFETELVRKDGRKNILFTFIFYLRRVIDFWFPVRAYMARFDLGCFFRVLVHSLVLVTNLLRWADSHNKPWPLVFSLDLLLSSTLRECVEKLQELSSPAFRAAKLQARPEVTADPHMDPGYESDINENKPIQGTLSQQRPN